MQSRVFTLLLIIGIVFGGALLLPAVFGLRPPGNRQGYAPEQPIAYSHRLHAGDLQIPCGYCHIGADRGRHAGIPAASTCMNCHQFVTAPLGAVRVEEELAQKERRQPRKVVSPELRKLYDALALDDNLQRDPAKTPRPIAWARIHKLPDFAYFDHSAHIAADLACQTCHGPVETMDRMRQAESLSMGWCVTCHRTAQQQGLNGKKYRASTDCATCHY